MEPVEPSEWTVGTRITHERIVVHGNIGKTTPRFSVRLAVAAALATVLSIQLVTSASPAVAAASTGAQHVTLDYCVPLDVGVTLCEHADILVNVVETPSGIFSQFDDLRGVVDIYAGDDLGSTSIRSYKLHFLDEDRVTQESHFQGFFEVVDLGTTVYCGVIDNQYANGQLRFERLTPC